jgi:hypothetical protein
MSPAPPAQRAGPRDTQPGQPAGRRRPPPPARARLRDALHAEWTKLRTVPGTFWLLAAATRCPAGPACPADTPKLALTGISLGQAVIATLAVAGIRGGEAKHTSPCRPGGHQCSHLTGATVQVC